MPSQAEDFSSLARTLCNNPHRTALLKNAFQYQHELSKMGLGSPKSTTADMTLFSLGGIRARAEDLQPLNDPFLIDNIFKSPKKRRRGLLSWSALPIAEVHRAKSGEKSSHQHEVVSQLWDFSRHIRARNRRRSILGTKHSMASMRRRRQRSSACGEHTRSISDPTSTISLTSPRAATVSRLSVFSGSAESSQELHAKNYRNTSCCSTVCRSSESLQMVDYSLRTSRRACETEHSQMHTFPRLNVGASTSSIFSDRVVVVPFPSPPPEAHCIDSTASSASTLRGVPGHPGAAGYLAAPSASTHSRMRPTTPYISISALRLISNNHIDRELQHYPATIREPAPALLKPENALRAQRCTSMPCRASGTASVVATTAAACDVRIANDGMWNIPKCLVAIVPCDIASPRTKFSAVKNSLEIRQPALCLRSCHNQCPSPPLPGAKTSSSDGSGWLLPTAVGVLRRMAFCGGRRAGSGK
ncbi:hypothetical protein H4S06_003102 [Coemansia sp. BCRC 34490]|nr:hypothetical protein H4S06_003102 [Coemansia sp. BCRC 34490]